MIQFWLSGDTYVWPLACRRQLPLPGRSWLCRCTRHHRSCRVYGSRGNKCPGWRSDETWGHHQWSSDFSATQSLAKRRRGDNLTNLAWCQSNTSTKIQQLLVGLTWNLPTDVFIWCTETPFHPRHLVFCLPMRSDSLWSAWQFGRQGVT